MKKKKDPENKKGEMKNMRMKNFLASKKEKEMEMEKEMEKEREKEREWKMRKGVRRKR